MVRSAGIAPASPDWHTGILLLNDDRDDENVGERGPVRGPDLARAPCVYKERTPLPRRLAPHPQDFSADVSVFKGTPPGGSLYGNVCRFIPIWRSE